MASQVIVFMLRGLYSDCKISIAYSFCSSLINYIILSSLILKSVEKLLKVCLYVKFVVCD